MSSSGRNSYNVQDDPSAQPIGDRPVAPLATASPKWHYSRHEKILLQITRAQENWPKIGPCKRLNFPCFEYVASDLD